jgi:glutaredoxin
VVLDEIELSKIAWSSCCTASRGWLSYCPRRSGGLQRVDPVRGTPAAQDAVASTLPTGGLGIIRFDPAAVTSVGVPYIRRKTLAQPQAQEARINLYTGDYCPYCRRVKKELDRLNLPYEEVYADANGREEVIRLSGQRAIPILTIDDEVLVDSSYIIRELRSRFG